MNRIELLLFIAAWKYAPGLIFVLFVVPVLIAVFFGGVELVSTAKKKFSEIIESLFDPKQSVKSVEPDRTGLTEIVEFTPEGEIKRRYVDTF